MSHPMTEPNVHLMTEQLATLALDEVRRLCLGPSQRGGRRWTMCVPVQADDSDVLIAGALRRQAADIGKLVDDHHLAGNRIADLHAEVEAATQRAVAAERRYNEINAHMTTTLLALRDAGYPCPRHQDVPERVAQLVQKLATLSKPRPE